MCEQHVDVNFILSAMNLQETLCRKEDEEYIYSIDTPLDKFQNDSSELLLYRSFRRSALFYRHLGQFYIKNLQPTSIT